MGSIILFILVTIVSIAWFIPGVKHQGDRSRFSTGDYVKTGLLYGFLFSSVLIIITEIIWDILFKWTGIKGLPAELLSDFFRAALLEEFFKFKAFKMAKKKKNLDRKIDYIMMAGLMGLVYSLVETLATGNMASAVLGIIFPMHILWQYNQGAHYYEHEQAKKLDNPVKARKEYGIAIFFTFFFHGTWDSMIDVILFLINKKSIILQVIGGMMLLGLLTTGIIYAVKTIKMVIRESGKET